ncbi:uncharacterized protein LOC117340440 [Pecten maximus]|uniref:uncharacterized protein LOC117340440 n=1 Tax=Pecten maximus TaxID=6579 RepID=UPI001458C507|nr:uncharacterized protein LOC117340440 [Pecten maximus]
MCFSYTATGMLRILEEIKAQVHVNTRHLHAVLRKVDLPDETTDTTEDMSQLPLSSLIRQRNKFTANATDSEIGHIVKDWLRFAGDGGRKLIVQKAEANNHILTQQRCQ